MIILILSMLLSPEFRLGDAPGRAVVLRLEDIFLFVVFLGWLARMAINKELGFLKKTALNQPIIVYVSICIVSTLLGAIAGNLNIKTGIFYLLKYLEYFMVFFMVVNNIRDKNQAKSFIFFLFLTCALVNVYSLMHLGSSMAQRVSAPFEGKGGEPNTFAAYLILMMALTLGFIIHTQSSQRRWLFIGLFFLMFIPFVSTLSRGGWLSFIPMILTLIIMCRRFKLQMIFVFIGFISLSPFLAPEKVKARIAETFVPDKSYAVLGKHLAIAESAAARVDSWGIGFKQWAKRPVLGWGIPAGVVIDNQYTRVLSETGLLGFMAFAWIIITLFSLGRHVYSNFTSDEFAQSVSLGFMAGLVGLLTMSNTAAVFILIRVMEPFWFIAAIVVCLFKQPPEGEGSLSRQE